MIISSYCLNCTPLMCEKLVVLRNCTYLQGQQMIGKWKATTHMLTLHSRHNLTYQGAWGVLIFNQILQTHSWHHGEWTLMVITHNTSAWLQDQWLSANFKEHPIHQGTVGQLESYPKGWTQRYFSMLYQRHPLHSLGALHSPIGIYWLRWQCMQLL